MSSSSREPAAELPWPGGGAGRVLVAAGAAAAAVSGGLAESGAAGLVLVGAAARRTWSAVMDPPPVPVVAVDGPGAVAAAVAELRPAELIWLGWPASGSGVPPELRAALAGRRWWSVTWAGGAATSDPLFWAVWRTGAVTVTVTAAGPDGERRREWRVSLPDHCDYPGAAALVADAVRPALAQPVPVEAVTADATGAEEAGHAAPDPEALAADYRDYWLRIDWRVGAEDVVRLVRAGAAPGPGAWTWCGDFRIRVDRAAHADPGEARDSGAPPGTVVAVTPDAVRVQTGHGQVALRGLTDAIGVVPPSRLTPGVRLGTDLYEEVDSLRQRMRDLELVVSRLARDADLLG